MIYHMLLLFFCVLNYKTVKHIRQVGFEKLDDENKFHNFFYTVGKEIIKKKIKCFIRSKEKSKLVKVVSF
jgi:hypothetical protein